MQNTHSLAEPKSELDDSPGRFSVIYPDYPPNDFADFFFKQVFDNIDRLR